MFEILFDKLKLGDIDLNNRIIMAPLTRQRSGSQRVPNAMMQEYYAQRASAGLIISEATSISPMGVGYKDTPGIWNQDQVDGWKAVTRAVHAKGGKIFLQLWHVGRISHPMFLNGETPVAPSAIRPAGHVSLVRPQQEFVTPRALSTEEVKELVQLYKRAGVLAKDAGFDGVEIHAANGYLIDQFIQSSTNHRTDEYGGLRENRCRFLMQITDSLIDIWGAGRVGVHLSPQCDYHDMGDEDPVETFTYIAKELDRKNVAFIFTRESFSENYITARMKQLFSGVMVANQELTPSMAVELIQSGKADAASWGKYFISNPDLPEKLRVGAELTAFDPSTFYSEGPKGYTDY